MTVSIEFDPLECIRRHFRALLAAEGVDYEPALHAAAEQYRAATGFALNETEWLCTQWFSVKKRKIAPAPRRVLRSSELKARSLPPAIASAVDRIEAMSIAGEDLTPFLSERWNSVERKDIDRLLNDWGIHHLHVGRNVGGRSRELLYVFAFDEVLLFIDVRDHDSFHDLELAEIAIRNWPEAFKAVSDAGHARAMEESSGSGNRASSVSWFGTDHRRRRHLLPADGTWAGDKRNEHRGRRSRASSDRGRAILGESRRARGQPHARADQ